MELSIVVGIFSIIAILVYKKEKVCIKDKSGKILVKNGKDSLEDILKYPYGTYIYEVYRKKIYDKKWILEKQKEVEYTQEIYEIYSNNKFEISKSLVYLKKDKNVVKEIVGKNPEYEDILNLPFGEYEVKIYLKNPYNFVEYFYNTIAFIHTRESKKQYANEVSKDKVEEIIRKTVDQDYYKIIRNISLLTISGKSKTSPIDKILIHKTGIYVISQIQAIGDISGLKLDRNFTVSYNDKKSKIYNPIKQNDTHLKALKNILGEDSKLTTSFIIFKDTAILNDSLLDVIDVKLLNEKNFEKSLIGTVKSKISYLSDSDIDRLYKKIVR